MISAIESGLPREQYNKFLTAAMDGLNYTFQVIAHKANLSFSEWLTNSSASGNDDIDFDTEIAGTCLFRFSGSVLEKYNFQTATGWSKITGFTMAASPLVTAPALVNTGSSLAAYVCTTSAVKTAQSTDITGNTWGSWSSFQGGTQTYYQVSNDLTSPSEAVTAVTSSSTLGAGYNDEYAFANTPDPNIWAANTATGWIQYTFPASHAISAYSITARSSFLDQNPKTWTLQYSTDGVSWTTVHTVASETNWGAGERRVYTVVPASSGLPAYAAQTRWRLNFTANNGSSVLALDEIEFFENVPYTLPDYIRVASAHPNRIHLIYKNHQKQLYNLRCAVWNGSSWTVKESDIWWTFDPVSFSVATLDGTDYVVMATEVPGATVDVSENNSPVKKLYTAGGVVCFRFMANDWSDHYEVDLLDNVTDWRYRTNARVNIINDLIVVTAYAGDGTESYPFEFYRYYTSKNGKHWSNSAILPLPDLGVDSGFGLDLLQYGDYVYALEREGSYRSLSVLPLGYSPPAQQLDITDYILDYGISTDGTLQTGMIVSNDGGWLDDNAILSRTNTIWLEHRVGFFVPERAMLTIGLTQVDALEFQETIAGSEYERTVRISARDKWRDLADLVVSEQANYVKSHAAAIDTFMDSTNTNYGGMSHTAIEVGSFRTNAQVLEVVSNNELAIAFSTLVSNVWNGSYQVGFNLSSTAGATGMYAGVVFRAIDTKNYWYARYEQASDTVVLGMVQGGVTKALLTPYQSSTLSWTNFAITRYIRVDFRYGLIRVFTSSDSGAGANDGGRTWTLAFEHKMDCSQRMYVNALKAASVSPIEQGYVGYIGKGKT